MYIFKPIFLNHYCRAYSERDTEYIRTLVEYKPRLVRDHSMIPNIHFIKPAKSYV